ncbi:hypothetical protein [Lysinibacillus sp. TE18511]
MVAKAKRQLQKSFDRKRSGRYKCFGSESKASATDVFCTESVATGTEVFHFYRW